MISAIYKDAESLICSYIRTTLPGFWGEEVWVSTDVPNPREEVFVRFIRTGGPPMNVVADRPQITVECWSINEEQAYTLAANVRYLLTLLQNEVWEGATFYRMDEFSGPINDPDAESQQARYKWTFTIGVRGQAPPL